MFAVERVIGFEALVFVHQFNCIGSNPIASILEGSSYRQFQYSVTGLGKGYDILPLEPEYKLATGGCYMTRGQFPVEQYALHVNVVQVIVLSEVDKTGYSTSLALIVILTLAIALTVVVLVIKMELLGRSLKLYQYRHHDFVGTDIDSHT